MPSNDAIAFLDRRVRTGFSGLTVTYSGGVTTWTLPYAVAVDGSEGTLAVYLESQRALQVTTRPSETQIAVAGADLSTQLVSIGILFPFTYVPSPPYLRDARGGTDLTAKITLHHVIAKLSETTSVGSLVARKGRPVNSQQSKTFKVPTKADFKIPVHADRDEAQVIIKDTSPGGCVLAGLTWSGTIRSPSGRRV